MKKKRNAMRVVCLALIAAALATLGLAGSASAKLVKEFTRFQQCPWTTAEAFKCIYAVTESGEVILGNKTVKIESPVVIQGSYKKPVANVSGFIGATNGETLTKVKQNVPGGLLGIVPPEKSGALVKALSKFFFENGLTGVTSTLELAQSASNITVNELNLTEKEGVAMKLPVRVHLENPFLGKSCYVGSSGSPITWELTAGTTNPAKPNNPITGNTGIINLLEGGRVLALKENSLVDNNWSAPTASGCGGILSFLVNPIINLQVGLSSPKGKNTAILNNTIYLANAAAVKKNDTDNP